MLRLSVFSAFQLFLCSSGLAQSDYTIYVNIRLTTVRVDCVILGRARQAVTIIVMIDAWGDFIILRGHLCSGMGRRAASSTQCTKIRRPVPKTCSVSVTVTCWELFNAWSPRRGVAVATRQEKVMLFDRAYVYRIRKSFFLALLSWGVAAGWPDTRFRDNNNGL